MNSLPCPNPACSNVFSAAELKKTGAVKCPRCGKEFTFRKPKPPAAPKPAAPKPAVAAPIAVAKPILPPANVKSPGAIPQPYYPPPGMYPPPPIAPPPMSPPPRPPGKAGSIVKVRGLTGAKPRHPLLKTAIVVVVVGIFLGAIYYAVSTWAPLLHFQRPGSGSASGFVFHVRNQRGANEKAITVSLDKDVWSPDKDIKNRMKATTAFKRIDNAADAWVAIALQDFGFRKPREGELLNGAIDRLRALFGDSMQINATLESTKIAGLPGWRCNFKGQLNVVWWGECYMVSHHGIGYWIFLAAPTNEGVQLQFAEFEEQQAIAFTTDRSGWTEQPPKVETFHAIDGSFSVKVPEKIWREVDPKTEDENGVIYLSGHFQNLQSQPAEFSTAKNATLVGVALEKKTDLREAYKEVVEYLEKKKREESKDYQFAPFKDAAPTEGVLGEVGGIPGCIGELRLIRGKDTLRYITIAVFNEGPKTYGLRFECSWDMQDVWRKEFREIMKTVRAEK